MTMDLIANHSLCNQKKQKNISSYTSLLISGLLLKMQIMDILFINFALFFFLEKFSGFK